MFLAFAVLCLSAAALADENSICSGDGLTLHGFGRPKSLNNPEIKRDLVHTKMPCKYHAVRKQKCGDFEVNLTPGNIYLHPKYRLDSLWFHAEKLDGSGDIEVRTNNKKAAKFVTGKKNYFLTKKRGSLELEDFFTSTNSTTMNYTAVAENADFRITFTAWDPERNYTQSMWSFECLAENFEPADYTQQLCAGSTQKVWRDERNFTENVEYPYYDVFTTQGIAQTNPKCTEAEDLFIGENSNCTSYEKKLWAIHTCSPILHDSKRLKCVTKYVCDAMDIFLSCVKWVCSDYDWKEECEKVGEAIDFCRNFPKGRLSERVEQANCYTEFLDLPDED